MLTFHIHINGLVQGVGFRPFVYRQASIYEITGWVNNTNNGVHIECTGAAEKVNLFYNSLISNPPHNAVISHHQIQPIDTRFFDAFTILQSTHDDKPDMLLTPDIAICHTCREELNDAKNKRFFYPFTTCLNCGPRYSITTRLPYDRVNTTMSDLQMCPSCLAEYRDLKNHRFYSQTNSCITCTIPMCFYSTAQHCISKDPQEILAIIITELQLGSIIAVKGTGGYLLMCDATNPVSINTLRTRKHRPAKPFALLYTDIKLAAADVVLQACEMNSLKDKVAPIVLCKLKSVSANGICSAAIAPGLDKIGVMLPNSALLLLIAETFGKPLIATSANISGSPIIYKDKDALENLFDIADYVLTYEREIVAPQDDSVIQFAGNTQQIILRRSRGLAPNYFPNPFTFMNEQVLAMGAELKSAFALLEQKNIYISQYLGDQGTLESQTCFKETLQYFTHLVKASPKNILIDKHPGYAVSQYGTMLAAEKNIAVTAIQHHEAHFGAVLAENNLLQSKEPVLGFIWDGTGYGDDAQIWGGEVFIFEKAGMKRVAHLNYFPQLLGDKMSREPRLSALSLLKHFPDKQIILKEYFSATAWLYYLELLQQPVIVSTSSMGRFLDGIAAILGIQIYNSYEGEAAMKLEVMAAKCKNKPADYYAIPLENDCLNWEVFIAALLHDYLQKTALSVIAWKVFFSLAKMIEHVSDHYKIKQIAFSGGVFQNALLVDLIQQQLKDKCTLYFHLQLSPNDECIGFGQIACFSLQHKKQEEKHSVKEEISFKNYP